LRDLLEAPDTSGVGKGALDEAYTNELALRAKQRWRA